MIVTLIPLPIAVPLIAAAFIALTGEWIGRRASDTLAIATAGANFWMSAMILRGVWFQPQVYWFGNWWPRSGGVALGICFAVDAIGAAMALLTALLTTAALIFAWRIFEDTENHFQPLMLIFMAAMCGFSYTGDLFNLFVFFELTGSLSSRFRDYAAQRKPARSSSQTSPATLMRFWTALNVPGQSECRPNHSHRRSFAPALPEYLRCCSL